MKTSILFFLLLMITGSLSAQNANTDSLSSKPKKENFADDWAALTKYQKENALLAPPKRKEKRVCVFGKLDLRILETERSRVL